VPKPRKRKNIGNLIDKVITLAYMKEITELAKKMFIEQAREAKEKSFSKVWFAKKIEFKISI
jgi:hypothetical protein